MTDKDIQRLLKLLNLTTSDNDHEALRAIRAANALMRKHCVTWDEVRKAAQQQYSWREAGAAARGWWPFDK